MGGSGGGSYGPISSSSAARLQKALEREQERLKGDVNDYLHELLIGINDRDTEAISSHLDCLRKSLGEDFEVDALMLGGSVAKHTAVSGISDVDALVVLDRAGFGDMDSRRVLSKFRQILNRNLERNQVESVVAGKLAVTVNYHDGTEIQLLPTLRSRSSVFIPASDGRGWNETKPKQFARQLTRMNDRLNGSLVPAIKLAKSLVASLPEQKRLTGYHIEAIAVDAARGYKGAATPRDALLRILEYGATRVRAPIRDKTNQSRVVDGYLGPKGSLHRRNVSQTLSGLCRRLRSATSLGQWKAMFDG